MLDALTAADVMVTVDVTGLPVGTADVQPQAVITGAQVGADEVRVIPATVGLILEPPDGG
ncbi:MAG: hypothetical protein MUC99_06340 [Anaerolineae bacterium]|nr:hypothetical protein [Anaerolineae bacterium]